MFVKSYLGSYLIVRISNTKKRFMFCFSVRKKINLVSQSAKTFPLRTLYALISKESGGKRGGSDMKLS